MPALTITTTAQQAQRVATAMGNYLRLKEANGDPRPATEAEIKAWLISQLRTITQAYERKQSEQQIVDTPFDPT